MNSYDRIAEEARDSKADKSLIAVEKARRAVVQRSSGKGAEDALLADAMSRIREQTTAMWARRKVEHCMKNRERTASI